MITALQFVIHCAESMHDKYVITGANPSDKSSNKMWHFWDAVCWTLVHMTISAAAGDMMFLFTGLCMRLFCLQVVLNLARGQSMYHLGSGPVDKIFVALGVRITFALKLLLVLLSFAYETYSLLENVKFLPLLFHR
jgi:hypothetical protein